MPTLNWIGKQAVINHHQQVPFHLLKDVPELSCGDPGSGNLIVQGDNLVALKALLPYYAKQVKCIYIDPPYNTGNEGWIYNDNVNNPVIRQWLGKVVGREGETLDRHDRWLCMMYPRLSLLRQLLADDGVLFISINDIEGGPLELIAREIFGPRNFFARLIWNTEGNTDNQLEVKINHEYVLMLVKDVKHKTSAIGNVIDPNTRSDSNLWKGLADNNINKNNPRNPPAIFTIPSGFPSAEEKLFYPAKAVDDEFFDVTKTAGLVSKETKSKYKIENVSGLPVKLDDLIVENFRLQKACRVYGGFANRKKLDEFVANDFRPVDDEGGPISFYINRNAAIRYRREVTASSNILSVLRNLGTTERTRTELRNMRIFFDYPKPVSLIQYLLSFGAQPPGSVILDCFAGSGTTGDATIRLNEDGGNRRFVMIELDSGIARNVAAQRIRLIAEGYKSETGEEIEGIGGSFRFCELGEPLFDENGTIRKTVRFCDLARHVYFTETGEPLPRERVKKSPLLGVTTTGLGVYLLYNGILQDRSVNGGNILTSRTLAMLPSHSGPKVVYAAGSRLTKARLKRENITFKQTPYAIKIK
jgi:adenine-specific DNA-methyltransferase